MINPVTLPSRPRRIERDDLISELEAFNVDQRVCPIAADLAVGDDGTDVAVFRAEDLKGYDDSRLSMLVTSDPDAPKNVTITRNGPFVIVSFGFRG